MVAKETPLTPTISADSKLRVFFRKIVFVLFYNFLSIFQQFFANWLSAEFFLRGVISALIVYVQTYQKIALGMCWGGEGDSPNNVVPRIYIFLRNFTILPLTIIEVLSKCTIFAFRYFLIFLS